MSRVARPTQPSTQPFYIYHFQSFLRRNIFSGHGSVQADIEEIMSHSGSGDYLMNAILCLGAMEAVSRQATKTKPGMNGRQFATEAYTNSIAGLRRALETQSVNQHTTAVLWTTILLGLFEVSDH